MLVGWRIVGLLEISWLGSADGWLVVGFCMFVLFSDCGSSCVRQVGCRLDMHAIGVDWIVFPVLLDGRSMDGGPMDDKFGWMVGGELADGRLGGGALADGRLVGDVIDDGWVVGGELADGRLGGGALADGRLVGEVFEGG